MALGGALAGIPLLAQQSGFGRERDLGKDGDWDNWRIEGPAFVWYFRGAPHVHSWIHIADNPETPVTSHFGKKYQPS